MRRRDSDQGMRRSSHATTSCSNRVAMLTRMGSIPASVCRQRAPITARWRIPLSWHSPRQ